MATLRLRYDEDVLWDLVWLLFGGPAMVTGFFVGMQYDDAVLMTGTLLVIALTAHTTRHTLTVAYERIRVFERRIKKDKPVLLLTVADSQNPDRTAVVEALNNGGSITVDSRLQVLRPSRRRKGNEPIRAGVFINGRSAASTLRIDDDTFLHEGQVLIVRSIEGWR